MSQGARYRHALTLASRIGPDALLPPLAQPQTVEPSAGLRQDPGSLGSRGEGGRYGSILERTQLLEEEEVLEDEA